MLEEILGTRNIYFQPPENLKLKYPCFVYEVSRFDRDFADNIAYRGSIGFSVTYITQKPDDERITALIKLPKTYFDRKYVVDNLYHYVYTIFI